MEKIAILLTAVFTGIAALGSVASFVVAWAAFREQRRREVLDVVAITKDDALHRNRRGHLGAAFCLRVVNRSRRRIRIIDWRVAGGGDFDLDFSPALKNQTLDEGAYAEGNAGIYALDDDLSFLDNLKVEFTEPDGSSHLVALPRLANLRSAAEET